LRLSNRYVVPAERALDDILKRLRSLIDSREAEIGAREGRVVIALRGDALFDEGRTTLKPSARTTLEQVARALSTIEGREFLVAAHADDALRGGRHFPSSWELSVARAVEVTRCLVDHGVKPQAIAAAGYGEFRPVGGEKNRRVEILI
jgi:chemotaxis protein MotB